MSGEKKHAPTQKKHDDSKKKGQVAVSKDIQTIAKLGLFYLLIFGTSSVLMDDFTELLNNLVTASFTQKWVLSSEVAWSSLFLFIKITGAFLAVTIAAATISNWAQTDLIISSEAAMPSMKRLNPVENVKNMFSKKTMVQLAASVAKVIILTWLTFYLLSSAMEDIVLSYRVGLSGMLTVLGEIFKDTVIFFLLILLVFTAIDWAAVYMAHIKSIKMSDQDIRDEMKETQGNPETKGRLRTERRNLLNSSLNRMQGAKAVVANPTHISIALDYEPGVHDLPYILAMGEDEEALEIRREAKRLHIPIVVNVKLARMIYSDSEEQEYIQSQHLELAAAVFKTIMSSARDEKTR